ncbi:hypothetical protein HHK36_013819 [Tetracentron sinense]|uniref:Myb/SANT-like domain-containing protein n=1 Tax=Tetracentron sinense TaxID=13715 RepID=A0A834Z4V6_TETSI|nr:hypothetical protein HHK36_013819 [Tetracentron sinense]
MVKIEDQPRYRTRKGRIAQNVMAAVGFDMKFTYVLDGWEGSARDPKVLKAAVRDAPTKLVIPAGNKVDNGWKPQTYQAVVNAIYEKLGISLNKEQSGFGWDDTKKMVTADDSVWDEYLKSHSDARPYRTKSIPDFDSFSLIIANDSANGSGMLSGFDAEHTTNQDDTFSRGTNIEDMRTGFEDLHEWDNPIRNEVPAPSAPLGASSSRLTNEAKKKKKTRREGSSDELSAMNANLRFIAEAINNTTAEVDMEPLMVELEKIPELDEDLVIEAAEYLSSDKKKDELVLWDE